MPNYQEPSYTQFPPRDKAMMVWDGQCDFCAYWIKYWQSRSGDKIDYAPFQEVASQFRDINTRHFLLASRLIETDGKIYSGPRSAYRSIKYYSKRWAFLDDWYARKKWFRNFSDSIYRQVTLHRGLLFKLMPWLFGSDPKNLRPFWMIYIFVLFWLLYQFL